MVAFRLAVGLSLCLCLDHGGGEQLRMCDMMDAAGGGVVENGILLHT